MHICNCNCKEMNMEVQMMYTVYVSFDEGKRLFLWTEKFLDAYVSGEVDVVHAESHQSIFVERHILLLVRMQHFHYLLKQAHFAICVQSAHQIAQLQQLLARWTLVEINHDWLNDRLCSLFACFDFHGLFLWVRLRIGCLLLNFPFLLFMHLLLHFFHYLITDWSFGSRTRKLFTGIFLWRLWRFFGSFWFLQFLILLFALSEMCIILLSVDIFPVLRKDLHTKLVKGLLQMQCLFVDLRVC